MKYTLYKDDEYLKVVKKNVSEEELKEFGKIISKIYTAYDKTELVGYIIKKATRKLYALKEKK